MASTVHRPASELSCSKLIENDRPPWEVYLHSEKMYKAISDDCLQSGQVPWLGLSRACSLSKFQRRFWMASQTKILH